MNSTGLAHVCSKFMQQASRLPRKTCIEFDSMKFSYAQVASRSEAIAAALADRGISSGKIVAVIAERSADLVWTLLGILRAGCTFAVLDSSYPEKRLQTLLQINPPAVVITCGLAQNISPFLEQTCNILQSSRLLKQGQQLVKQNRMPAIDFPVPDDQPAYLLFTSGTTGRPKCVASSHAPLINFVAWQTEAFGLSESFRFSMFSGLSHDPVLRDIFTPLSIGATLCIPKQSQITELGGLRNFIHKSRIDVVHLTPSMGQLILSARRDAPILKTAKFFFWGGDQLRSTLVAEMQKVAPHAEHVNFYGSTETPQAAAFFRCPKLLFPGSVPIGSGTQGFKISIIAPDGAPVAHGDVGEVAITSAFLSLGYMENNQLRSNSQSTDENSELRIYRTGDQGRFLDEQNIVLLGRVDDQVKIRGYRVDLSEVTEALCASTSGGAAIALAIGPPEAKKIVAFVGGKPQDGLSQESLLKSLEALLPVYMLPTVISFCPKGLPLLPNGKIDRASLIHSMQLDANESPSAPDQVDNPILQKLINDWATLFHRKDIRPSDSFNSLGGDSLSYVNAFLSIEEALGSVPDSWEEIPLKQLAASGKSAQKIFSSMDSSIVMRATAMTLIVALHCQLTNYGFGATSALFVVSGFLFAKTLAASIFNPKKSSTLLRPLHGILLPTAIFSLLSAVSMYITKHQILVVGTLFQFDLIPPHFDVANVIWYVDALIKIILATAAIQWIAAKISFIRARQKLFLTALVVLLWTLRFLQPVWIYRYFPAGEAHDISTLNTFSNFALFYMGILLAQSLQKYYRCMLLLAVTAYCTYAAYVFGRHSSAAKSGLYIILASFLLSCLPRIPVPRLISRYFYEVAAASLYIYLLQYWVLRLFPQQLPSSFWLALRMKCISFALCILAGILLYRAIGKFKDFQSGI